jgi:hypothetical protein
VDTLVNKVMMDSQVSLDNRDLKDNQVTLEYQAIQEYQVTQVFLDFQVQDCQVILVRLDLKVLLVTQVYQGFQDSLVNQAIVDSLEYKVIQVSLDILASVEVEHLDTLDKLVHRVYLASVVSQDYQVSQAQWGQVVDRVDSLATQDILACQEHQV